ncbi:MAG: hypothetical protein Fur0034_05140 [Desulfuromonadia bacterium]
MEEWLTHRRGVSRWGDILHKKKRVDPVNPPESIPEQGGYWAAQPF